MSLRGPSGCDCDIDAQSVCDLVFIKWLQRVLWKKFNFPPTLALSGRILCIHRGAGGLIAAGDHADTSCLESLQPPSCEGPLWQSGDGEAGDGLGVAP